MARNTEIKAHARDWETLCVRAQALADHPPERLSQVDTFFVTPRGRLKLREFAQDRGELIYYEREDTTEAKTSHYEIVALDEPGKLRALLAAALGVRGVVRKERWLYLVGQTRIHLDHVEGLGEFLELEVVLREEQTPAEGRRIAQEIQARLGVADTDLVACAYLDLILRQT